ncbi:GntR family transcriptional regulator [Aquibacillus sediminis]|uniref:GntR family transcriptional regulator n=1 Tax=Aquibacillus sediminis TaxID=2574734 RepID=UPI00110967AF|nr:GntR family transcriptional regulator [Aquibacillus sediminis]
MAHSFLPDKPIYLQLVDRISSEIVRGERLPGDKLPSVRDYAIESGVNANTVQRVYRELEFLRVVETRRGQGTFVIENQEKLNQLREDMKQKYIDLFVTDMRELGFTLEEMVKGILHYQEREGGSDD